MNDPFGSLQGFLNQFSVFLRNPEQMMMGRQLPLPLNWMQNPASAIQNLMDSGRMSQQQYNALRQIAERIQQLPQAQQMFARYQPNQPQ